MGHGSRRPLGRGRERSRQTTNFSLTSPKEKNPEWQLLESNRTFIEVETH
jgi:hypothetical protein